MSTEMLEQKIAELERRLEAVESLREPPNDVIRPRPDPLNASGFGGTTGGGYPPKPRDSWKKLFGWSKNDTLLSEAARLGAEWRQQMNREGE